MHSFITWSLSYKHNKHYCNTADNLTLQSTNNTLKAGIFSWQCLQLRKAFGQLSACVCNSNRFTWHDMTVLNSLCDLKYIINMVRTLTLISLNEICFPQSSHLTNRWRHSFFRWSSILASNTRSPHPVFLHSTVTYWQLCMWSYMVQYYTVTAIYNWCSIVYLPRIF